MKKFFFPDRLLTFIVLIITACNNNISQEENNRKVVTRYFEEVLNNKKLDRLSEILDTGYIYHNLQDGSDTKGFDQIKEFLPYLFRAFPDLHYTIEKIVADDEKVAVQTIITGTQQEEFWGYRPTNQKIRVAEVFFMTLKNNKIVEYRVLLDFQNLDIQLSSKE